MLCLCVACAKAPLLSLPEMMCPSAPGARCKTKLWGTTRAKMQTGEQCCTIPSEKPEQYSGVQGAAGRGAGSQHPHSRRVGQQFAISPCWGY